MPKLVNFMICDTINNVVDANGRNTTNLVNPLMVLRPQVIPSGYSFGISFGVADIDLNKVNKLGFSITNPNGDIVEELAEADFPAAIPVDSNLPSKYQGLTISIDIRNMMISVEGEYVFTVFINGEKIEEIIIPAYKRS